MRRHLVFPVIVLLAMQPAALASAATTTLASLPSLKFYPTLTESAFASISADVREPAPSRHRPFLVPAEGLNARNTALAIVDLTCTPKDRANALAALAVLAEWSEAPLEGGVSSALLRIAHDDARSLAWDVLPLAGEGAANRPAPADSAPGFPAPSPIASP